MNINFKVIGGQPSSKQLVGGDTVADLMAAIDLEGNYTIKVNGESADKNETLYDEDFVVFTAKVKGGLI